MSREDDWFSRKNESEKDDILRAERDHDWDTLNEHEKSRVYEREENGN